MAHKLTISIFIVSLIVVTRCFSQGNFMFNQHGGTAFIGESEIAITAIDTTSASNITSKTIRASDYISYINMYVKYIGWGKKFVNPSDYDEIKSLTVGTPQYNVYYNFMSQAPYRSIWSTETMSAGNKLDITKYLYFAAKDTIHIGIFADNYFDLFVNGDTLAKTNRNVNPTNSFLTSFHLFEVVVNAGENIISMVAESDGSTSDALGFMILNNSKNDLFDNPVSKSLWNVLGSSDELIGQTLTIATCPNGYNYDYTRNFCYQPISQEQIHTGDILIASPIIDSNYIVNPTSWTMYFGDGSNDSKSDIRDKYEHIYTTSGNFNMRYDVTKNNTRYVIFKTITIN